MLVAMNRKALGFFPTLYGTNLTAQIVSNPFPGIEFVPPVNTRLFEPLRIDGCSTSRHGGPLGEAFELPDYNLFVYRIGKTSRLAGVCLATIAARLKPGNPPTTSVPWRAVPAVPTLRYPVAAASRFGRGTSTTPITPPISQDDALCRLRGVDGLDRVTLMTNRKSRQFTSLGLLMVIPGVILAAAGLTGCATQTGSPPPGAQIRVYVADIIQNNLLAFGID